MNKQYAKEDSQNALASKKLSPEQARFRNIKYRQMKERSVVNVNRHPHLKFILLKVDGTLTT